MAILNVERNAIVIRIVYDGPPEAGKTTSLRALSASLGRPMTTPAEDRGRTLFFDWLEYTGGLFEGRQICCQIVTVPGQKRLAHRRRALLETADVVVFVSDSTAAALDHTRVALEEMRTTLDAVPGPPVGAIVQANKRDLPGAVDLATLRGALPERGVAVVESVATNGRGVREVFVFAVRLALDRVRELLRRRALRAASEMPGSEDLLRQLQEREPSDTLAGALLHEVVAGAGAAIAEELEPGIPRTPDHNVPPGMIWPPVEGRVLLLDACADAFAPRQSAEGDWIGDAGEWQFHSPRRAEYADAEVGRRALVDWARIHATGQRWFSSPRVVVLAATGSGTWRLWQIVKKEDSLRALVTRDDPEPSPHAFLRRLLDAGHLLLAATESLPLAPCRLPITVDTIGGERGTPRFVAFLPDPLQSRAAYAISAEHRPAVLRRELGTLASAGLRDYEASNFPALREVACRTDSAVVVDALGDVLKVAGLKSGEQAPAAL